jgi:hypothetical protein
MAEVILPKPDLTSLVLAEIRKCEGCEGVDAVVILQTKRRRSVANWEIAIVVGGGNPAAAQRASAEVQKRLHPKYGLPVKVNRFETGDRVRLSKLGKSRVRTHSAIGTVIGVGSPKASAASVRVRFDGQKTVRRLHFSYLEMINESAKFSADPELPRTNASNAVERGPADRCH